MIIGDGARWIWNVADELFPDAIQITDMYDAKGPLSQIAKDLCGPQGKQTEQWGKARRDELGNGQMQGVLEAMDAQLKTSIEALTPAIATGRPSG